jgi:putative ABC transport system permease protein
MRILKALLLAIFGLWTNRVRVLLSMLGVIIGVFAIVMLASVGTGVQQTILTQMNGLGSEQMIVMPGRVLKDGQGEHNFMNGISNVSSTLTYEDVKEIRKAPTVEAAAPHLESIAAVTYGEKDSARRVEGILAGVTKEYEDVMHTEMAAGRFLTDSDEENESRVVVLGNDIHRQLLGQTQSIPAESVESEKTGEKQETPVWKKIMNWFLSEKALAEEEMSSLLGQEIKIKDETFKVIGVLQSQAAIGSTVNNHVILPISTALNVTNAENLTRIYVKAKDGVSLDAAERDTFSAVRKHHGESDFSVVKQTEMLKATSKITNILQVMIIGITAIAFIISGVGIMNVMTMSVRERTREIGIRKALGGKMTDILLQFLFETILLTTIGGVLGLLAAIAGVHFWNESIDIFKLILPMWAIKFALISSFVSGILFGIYPAFKAAMLQPSQALRYGD